MGVIHPLLSQATSFSLDEAAMEKKMSVLEMA